MDKSFKETNGKYDFSKAEAIYCNRSIVIPSDEEILLALGIEHPLEPGKVRMFLNAYLSLPTFLRTYDAFKSTFEDFKKRGIFGTNEGS